MARSWTCPYCNRPTTITDADKAFDIVKCFIPNTEAGGRGLEVQFIVCPNDECKELTLSAEFLQIVHGGIAGISRGPVLKRWQLIPSSKAKPFPDYVPRPIRNDYDEACLIIEGSAKASATLSRRCLQGMIRDYWGIQGKRTLKDEIDAIEAKVDPLTWSAIHAVRMIGNIGAHMESDISLIVDVDPGEAEALIELIEMLITEWYIHRHERELRLKEIVDIAAGKKELKTVKLATEIKEAPEN